jgi:thioesterase domain-containing protein/acyl carrier protein
LVRESAQATSQVEEQLAGVWAHVLGRDQIGSHEDFASLGGGSLEAAEVVVAIQKQWGMQLPLTTLLEAPTIEALTRVIEQRSPSPPDCTLVAFQPHGPHAPFFCVHGVGGTVVNFQRLASHLGSDQPFYGIRAVGADGFEEPFSRIEDMARRYLQDIRTIQPKGPYFLGGFSFGGSVALEMAQQMWERGEKVGLLAILDHTPPPVRYGRFDWTPTLPFTFLVNTFRWAVDDLYRVGPRGGLRTLGLGLTKLANNLAKLIRSVPGSGKTDVDELFSADRIPEPFRRVLETHYQALRDYHPRPYPGCVSLFRARTRPLFRLHGNDLGWRSLARGGLDVIPIPGNHMTILEEPNVRVLATALIGSLREARAI